CPVVSLGKGRAFRRAVKHFIFVIPSGLSREGPAFDRVLPDRKARMQQELPVPLSSENGRLDDFHLYASQLFHGFGDPGDRCLLYVWIAYDTTFTDLIAARFELRLYQDHQVETLGRCVRPRAA